jgi:hypothetical protein
MRALRAQGRQMRLVDFEASAFFDKAAVMEAIGKKRSKALNAIGREVRYQARGSMKLTPLGVASPAGQPPHRHRKTKKNKRGGDFWRSILYAYDRASGGVVIGPSTIFGRNIRTIAERHEYGGKGRFRNPRRMLRRVGDGGEIRVERRRKRTWTTAKRAKDTLLGPVWVIYCKLRTEPQARRANEINTALYGPAEIPADYPQRPTMGPALADVTPRVPTILTGIWAMG